MLKSLVVLTALFASTAAFAAEKEKVAIGVPEGLKVLKANRNAEADAGRYCASKGGTVQVDMTTCKVRTPDGGGRSCSAACFGSDGKRIGPTVTASGS